MVKASLTWIEFNDPTGTDSCGGDAQLKMTASWELVELEDGPQVREINNEVIYIWNLVTVAVLRLLVVNRHFNVVELIFTGIYHSPSWWQTEI